MAVCPCLGEGRGPSHLGWLHAITSKSRTYKSLKYYFPFVPPNINIFVSATKTAEWPYLADGDPIPSGPCSQVIETGSSACKSLNTFPLAPRPPNIIILDPASTAEWAYLGAGGVPEILGFYINFLNYCKFISIDIKNISIVKISIPLIFASIIMPPKNDNRSSRKCSSMTTSLTWTNTLNNRISPLPSSNLHFTILKFGRLWWVSLRGSLWWHLLLLILLSSWMRWFWMLWMLWLIHLWLISVTILLIPFTSLLILVHIFCNLLF